MKKNGFVFMETLVVVSILTLTLMLLYTSYAYILNKTKERNVFDSMETVYKVYNIKKILTSSQYSNGTLLDFFKKGKGCELMIQIDSNRYSYKCDLSSEGGTELYQVRNAYEVDKLYYVNPYQLLSYTDDQEKAGNNNYQNWIMKFDASTIDYLRHIGKNVNNYILVVKFKKTYNKKDGTYEVINASDAEMIS